MNIWYLGKYAAPSKYGFGTRHFHLADAWSRRGHNVVVFASNWSHVAKDLPQFRGNSWREQIGGVTAVWLNAARYESTSGARRVLSWLEFECRLLAHRRGDLPTPDVVVASSLSLLTVLTAAWWANYYNARLVFEVRDIWPLSAVELSGISPRHPFIRGLSSVERFGYRRADVIVGTMPNLAAHVARVSPQDAGKVACIPQGVAPSAKDLKQAPLPESVVARIDANSGLRVGYAGRLNANNPLEDLIEAAGKLAEQGVQIFLLGEGSEREGLEVRASGLDNVHFLGSVKRNQVADFLSRMDVCYDSFTSTLGEFGLSRNKWIDYMLSGTPVVCAFDGYRSMINEANAGAFTQFGDPDALAKVLLELRDMPQADRERMGEAGREWVLQHRSFERLGDLYLDLFNSN